MGEYIHSNVYRKVHLGGKRKSKGLHEEELAVSAHVD